MLGNAVKFTRKGSVSLRVKHDAATGMLQVEVGDTGPGIAADEIDRAFRAFEQVGAAATRPLEGPASGLTIARDIARAMGGDLVLESEIGRGTSARFNACCRRRKRRSSRRAPARKVAGVRHARAAGRDDDVNALIAVANLEHLGAEVERVCDGAGHCATRCAKSIARTWF